MSILCGTQAKAETDPFSLKLPSSAFLQTGGGSDSSRDTSLGVLLSQNNFQVSMRADESVMLIESENIQISKLQLGLGSDPLDEFSIFVSGEGATSGSDARAYSLGIDLNWLIGKWALVLTPAVSTLKTTNTPSAIDERSEISIRSSSLKLAAEYFAFKHVSLKAFVMHARYQDDLAYFARPVASALVPLSSQLFIFSLPSDEVAFDISYSKKKWSVTGEVAQSQTAIENQQSLSTSFSASFEVVKTWVINALLSKSDALHVADADEPVTSVTVGLLHSWR